MSKNEDYIRNETVFGIAPMLKSERTSGFWDNLLATSGFAIATWCYTQGAYSAGFLTFDQLLITVFCTSLLWVCIECIPVLFAVRYGIDLWIWLRAALGRNGVKVFCVAVILANWPWYAVAADMFSSSLQSICQGFGLVIPSVITPWLGVICVLLGTLIALGGPKVIKWWSRILVTTLLAVGVIVVIICFTIVPVSDLMAIQPDLSAFPNKWEPYMLSVEGCVAFAFSWSTQALVMPRLCKNERAGYWSTSIAYGIVAPFFILAGGIMALVMFATSGYYESDPTVMLSTLLGPGAALLSLVLVAVANIGTQGVGSYVNDMVLKSGFPKVNYKVFVWLSAVYVSCLTYWGGVTEHFGSFISLAAYVQGPIIGITLVDYLIVRHRKLSLKSAYNQKGHAAYEYTHGFNLVGIACVVIGFTCGMLIYNPMTGIVSSPIFYFTTGSGFTVMTGALAYFLISCTPWGKRYMLRDRGDLEIV